MEFQFSKHAELMMIERNISFEWISQTLAESNFKEIKKDGTIHFIKSIEDYQGKFLRVVINPEFQPPKIITLFFDRRINL